MRFGVGSPQRGVSGQKGRRDCVKGERAATITAPGMTNQVVSWANIHYLLKGSDGQAALPRPAVCGRIKPASDQLAGDGSQVMVLHTHRKPGEAGGRRRNCGPTADLPAGLVNNAVIAAGLPDVVDPPGVPVGFGDGLGNGADVHADDPRGFVHVVFGAFGCHQQHFVHVGVGGHHRAFVGGESDGGYLPVLALNGAAETFP